MSIDGRLLKSAKAKLDKIKLDNTRELKARLHRVYAQLPEIQEIDARLRRLSVDAVSLALRTGGSVSQAIDGISKESLVLQSRRRQLLNTAGYPSSYTDELYSCMLCKDEGYVDSNMCSCLKALYNKEMSRQLSSLFKLGNETFETFDPDLYSSEKDKSLGVSPREWMETVCETCKSYALRFGSQSVNLLFQGAPGLGKTFLSACIARVVADRGYSVVYETAVGALEGMEQHKFRKSGEYSEDVAADVRRFFDCDLMILDDLGTEMPSSFNASALYTLINTRLISGKKTVISTNLTVDELKRRYPPQTMSRLEGEYLSLQFAGSDIRKIRKERSLS